MNVEGDGVRLFLGDEESEQSDDEFSSGIVCVRTLRSPDKTTANEDAAAVIPIGDEALVLAVADGVGGTPAGREASDPGGLRSAILDAVEEANRTVIALSRGAATTLVVGEVFSRQLRSYHVGDSELIAVGQRGRVKARVVPHSPTGFAVEAGLLDAEEAMQHDQRHVLFNVIGSPDMRVEIGTALRIADRDTVLLASDGLLDNLYLDEIIDAIRIGPVSEAADRLVGAARERMAGTGNGELPCKPDDLTIILYRRHPPPRDSRTHSRPVVQRPDDAPD
jgi:PPM family protein phosphatase